ncbi:MAG: hypothetical protein NTW32_15190 [Chloroflexi bacterium]|nr:hypothetical protein [Chloroflexota bacterium]
MAGLMNSRITRFQGRYKAMQDNANTWHSKELGDGIWAPSQFAEIEAVFLPVFSSDGKPVKMAVFTRHESEGRLHCEVVAYFSPAANQVAEIFEAQPCQKPSFSGLGLLAGDPGCWAELFPEKGE